MYRVKWNKTSCIRIYSAYPNSFIHDINICAPHQPIYFHGELIM